MVSGKPPLLEIIAQPLLLASKLVLPKGSSHREQTTAILVFSKYLELFYDLQNLIFLNLDD